jgi:para-aminobenzoate synthetase/4-amino-4-deoxychorismate lyase
MPPSCAILLDDSLDPGNPCHLFVDPVEIVTCDRPEDADAAIDRIARGVADGHFAAGFLSYELGYLMEPRLAPLLPTERQAPLVWMGLFQERRRLTSAEAGEWVRSQVRGGYGIDRLRLSTDRAAYLESFRRVLDYIAAGDVYQINLTLKYLFDFSGDPFALYQELRRRQRVAFGALIAAPDFHLLSLSPELFLRIADGTAEARPMKGTAARGRTPEEDAEIRRSLAADEKSRAENLMIVDLLRNDLGRVAEIGSVRVTDLFTVETYRTVHQMTSGIRARLRPGTDLPELLRGLFPCGSVTGAPKVRAMEIIRELENAPRGVYTGSIGMISPGGDACFNVAIRTVMIDADGRGELGIGSGVVHDSLAESEFEECLLKAEFLTRRDPAIRLIETLRWEPGAGFWLLDRHLERLAASAAHLGFVCDLSEARQRLEAAVSPPPDAPRRVRLLLDEAGGIEVSAAPMTLPAPGQELRCALSPCPVDSRDLYLYHKTTRRDFYEAEFERMQRATGCDEVVFVNERGEVTEGSRMNLFLERDGRLLTPPVRCGLLDGTLRRELLDSGRAEEAVIHAAEIREADRILLGNSVRGLLPARMISVGET